MKTFLKIGVLAAALTFSGNLAAQENMQTDNSNLLRFYDSELFQWDYSMFGGLTLNFQNQSAITIYGIKEPMKKAFLLYEDTSQQYRAYRGKNIAGNVLMWGGLTAVLAGTCIPINWQDGSYKNNLEAAAGLILGGAVAELIGLFVLQSGQENIFNAINMYNRHRMNEYK